MAGKGKHKRRRAGAAGSGAIKSKKKRTAASAHLSDDALLHHIQCTVMKGRGGVGDSSGVGDVFQLSLPVADRGKEDFRMEAGRIGNGGRVGDC